MEKMELSDNKIIKIFPMPCLRVNEHGIITDLNAAAEKLTGYSKKEAVGKDQRA